MAQIRGNRGEWSEIYAFLWLMATGKLFAADEDLNRIDSMFFPVLKIFREEVLGTKYEYVTGEIVKICLGDTLVMELPASIFRIEAEKILSELLHHSAGTGAFSVKETESFMRKIHINVLKARSTDKSDINVQLRDVNTGFEHIVGFSIKSELGSSPTLLNASRSTNFIYRVEGLPYYKMAEINAIRTVYKILDRIAAIKENGGSFSFIKPANSTLANNLMMIDSQMSVIIAEMLVAYYSGTAKTSLELLNHVTTINPLSRPFTFYEHKFKELLCAVALGMKPATPWDGSDEATGGYIVVKTDGEVLAYHIYNRNSFKGYLLNNTRFESGSTTRHEYASLYEEEGELRIKLNLQIRFTRNE